MLGDRWRGVGFRSAMERRVADADATDNEA